MRNEFKVNGVTYIGPEILFKPETSLKYYIDTLNSIDYRIRYMKREFIKNGEDINYIKCDDVQKEMNQMAEKIMLDRLSDLSNYIKVHGNLKNTILI